MMIKAEKLSAGYGKKIVVENAEFTINKGEIITLIGSNGSGKSTLLKTIARQLEPCGGRLFIENREIKEYSGKEFSKKLSIMMTGRMKTELMTCRDVVESGRYPYTGMLGILSDEDIVKTDEAMKLVRAEELAECDFGRISDGQRQRVLLARAICQNTEIMLLDEPTSFLDVRCKLELLSLLRNMVKQKGITVIMSLHEIDLAKRISDRVICIKNGKTDRIGSPDEILTDEYISSLFDIDFDIYKEFYDTGNHD